MGNMKGALAAMCLATAVLNRHRDAWNGRLTMTAVSDEVMFGERGSVFLLRERPDVAGDFLISGEGPGFMGLAVAEKGLLWLDIEARAAGGHASCALRGETAVMKLAALLARLDVINETYATLPRELVGVTGGEGQSGAYACRSMPARLQPAPCAARWRHARARRSISGCHPASPCRRASR